MNRSSYDRHVNARTQPRAAAHASEVGDTCDVDVVHLDSVAAARDALPDDLQLARTAELLALLSSTTRLKMLLALQPRMRGARQELCVCDLAAVTGASKSLTSHQLRLLRAAGLVAVRRSGKLAYYRLADGPATDLLRDALTVSVAWTPS
ncbi:MAG: ArsR/SmtB family transcription factor [Gemmatimonadaceae bacterium]